MQRTYADICIFICAINGQALALSTTNEAHSIEPEHASWGKKSEDISKVVKNYTRAQGEPAVRCR
jgi:hypothetical protein